MGRKVNYADFILRVVLVAILTAFVGSGLSYVLGFFDALGTLSNLVTAFVLAGVLLWTLNWHPKGESFLEVIPIVLISAALVEVMRTWIPSIPTVITSFSWTSLAILVSSIYLSDTIVKKYILR